LKILHIDTGREMRGGQWQALYLMRGLLLNGHRIRVLAPSGSPLFQAAKAQAMDIQPVRLPSLMNSLAGFDLIHAHDARAHTVGLLCPKPLVVSRRVAFPVRATLASRLKYRGAAHYIAVSQFVKGTLLAANVPADRISVVYDGVPIGPAPVRSEHRTTILAVDSSDPGKGKKIIEEAAKLADAPVHFSDNLTRDLPEAALFVYITELEGLGSAALLAMAAGAPVLASRVGGLPEIIEDGVAGLLTSNEPEAVASQIRRLLNDRPFATRLATVARARVEQRFSIEHMVSDTIRVYEGVLS
jgi:glycosyl transferase family 1/glycosyl transferase family 4